MADALKLSEIELTRYQYMAESAAQREADMWAAAGVVEGAAVADVGCGPGATSAVLARLVGHSGHVRAVDRDPDAVAAAQRSGLANLTVSVGEADDTGLEPASVDVVMMRHVLAHNGGREQAVVDHLTSLVKPGGSVYLADTEYTGVRTRPAMEEIEPDLADIAERYARWHRARGNDLSIGLRLGELLLAAGLEDVQHHGRYDVFALPPGARHPSWAGRDAMVADGLATQEDIERWDAACVRYDALQPRPVTFVPMFLAFGRRP